MKDKLKKNHHRGVYYRVKAIFFVFAVFTGAIAVAVIPTYILIKENVKEATIAEIEDSGEDSENEIENNQNNILNYLP